MLELSMGAENIEVLQACRLMRQVNFERMQILIRQEFQRWEVNGGEIRWPIYVEALWVKVREYAIYT